ncbi:MAG: hypothetical protein L0Y66_17805 [Myxococcaceae bacterium]|nr:hypothetical protein [Myxococcaceae bacterium]
MRERTKRRLGAVVVVVLLVAGSAAGAEPESPAASVVPAQGKAKGHTKPKRGPRDDLFRGELGPLSMVPTPQPVLGNIIDKDAAVRLGKAFFWDVQTSSDGQVACASCHFQAGVDKRTLNTIHPGNQEFQAVSGPGQDFNGVSITTDDRVGSQGVVFACFQSISSALNNPVDVCLAPPQTGCAPDPIQELFRRTGNRSVTGRNSPTMIGAVFNRQNFWDGRANDVFNRVDPFGNTGNSGPGGGSGGGGGSSGPGGGGSSGPGSGTGIRNASVSSAALEFMTDSLASQAVGPPGDSTEMSCFGRPFKKANSIGAKLVPRQPLQFQKVAPTDSVFGSLAFPRSASPANGLICGSGNEVHRCTYQELIRDAFGAAVANNAVEQFSNIWGQAVQAYVATLIPNDTPFDRFLAGDDEALTRDQERGLGTFRGKGQCVHCHAGPELTDASVSFFREKGPINEDGGDQGFHNIGVRPTAEDLGRAGVGPKGVSFSASGARADRGAFKTVQLRNVGLTAPYFHNGGKATLEQVVDFYSRGGDFRNPELGKRIRNLGLSPDEQREVVEFLRNGLTDCRVKNERAPFDHPSLVVPNGPTLPAVGAAGTGPCP